MAIFFFKIIIWVYFRSQRLGFKFCALCSCRSERINPRVALGGFVGRKFRATALTDVGNVPVVFGLDSGWFGPYPDLE